MPSYELRKMQYSSLENLLENESTKIVRKSAAPGKMAASKKRSGGLTPAGRKRLSEAMKKRWADRKKKGS